MGGIDAFHAAKGWRQKLVDEPNGKFGLADFSRTAMLDVINNIFRVFVPVNVERQRKLNTQFGHRLNIFLDSLFDYPTIIQSKLGMYGSWEQYNRLLTVQLGGCNFRCWYCYCDDSLLRGEKLVYLTAEELVDKFIEQRVKDMASGLPSNVLRISGGEPFLAPDLILGCLEEIKKRRLDERIFVWSETNLSPFLKESVAGKSLVEEWTDLDKISGYKNFAVHPCVHGITPESLYEVTRVDGKYFEGLIDGLGLLIQHRIDIYPTFSPNMCPPEQVESFFQKLLSINRNLPLRFALIEYHLDYPAILARSEAYKHETIYNKYLVVQKWNELLQETYDLSYAEKPRHDIPLW
jgi:uncharacterized Fe-S cluster-containing radical SAM superfamily protein